MFDLFSTMYPMNDVGSIFVGKVVTTMPLLLLLLLATNSINNYCCFLAHGFVAITPPSTVRRLRYPTTKATLTTTKATTTKTVKYCGSGRRIPVGKVATSLFSSDSNLKTSNNNNINEIVYATTSNSNDNNNISTLFTKMIEFPPYEKLMESNYGECIKSETFTIAFDTDSIQGQQKEQRNEQEQCQQQCDEFDFCIKLYPRGGGDFSNSKNNKNKNTPSKSGFGMAYRIEPDQFGWMQNMNRNEKVAIYLQYLPRPHQSYSNIAVDTSFGFTLIGNQRVGRKFNIEWKSGIRFVPLEYSRLAAGQANDFGCNLLQTSLLESFLGCDTSSSSSIDGNDEKDRRFSNYDNQTSKVQVDIMIHQIMNNTMTENSNLFGDRTYQKIVDWITPRDIRNGVSSDLSNDNDGYHDMEQVRVGRIVVPVLTKLSQRPAMFASGVYPGVEYRIMRIIDDNNDVFYSRTNVDYELRPIYPLVPQLERQWPVRINEKDIPKLYTSTMYNVISAIGSLITAITGLLVAFTISQAVSLYYIPSRSMEPTLNIGDVLLVEKVSPRLQPLVGTMNKNFYKNGDVVLFSPPQTLIDIVAGNGQRINDRDLFVKRVAVATPGDTLTVMTTGDVFINDQIPLEQRNLCTAEPLKLLQKYYLQQPPSQIQQNDDNDNKNDMGNTV